MVKCSNSVDNKSPEPVGSGLERENPVSGRDRFVEQSQDLGCAQSHSSGGLAIHNLSRLDILFHKQNYTTCEEKK